MKTTRHTPMKKILAFLCVAWATPALIAQSLTADELQRATEHLTGTRDALVAASAGLSDAQLNYKPDPTRWSVADVTEHLAATEDFLLGFIRSTVMKAPARTEPVDVREIDEFVLRGIADRTNKVQAPEPLRPTNRFGNTAEALAHFMRERARTLAFLQETPDLREHAMDSPIGKKLDAYQWVLFIAAHCERHLKQIDEVKADSGFPRD